MVEKNAALFPPAAILQTLSEDDLEAMCISRVVAAAGGDAASKGGELGGGEGAGGAGGDVHPSHRSTSCADVAYAYTVRHPGCLHVGELKDLYKALLAGGGGGGAGRRVPRGRSVVTESRAIAGDWRDCVVMLGGCGKS